MPASYHTWNIWKSEIVCKNWSWRKSKLVKTHNHHQVVLRNRLIWVSNSFLSHCGTVHPMTPPPPQPIRGQYYVTWRTSDQSEDSIMTPPPQPLPVCILSYIAHYMDLKLFPISSVTIVLFQLNVPLDVARPMDIVTSLESACKYF